jgi:hypothetical protein
MSRTGFLRTSCLVACSILAACGDDGGSTGQISVAVTDSPVDYADAVVVRFTGVELKPKEGPAFVIDFDAPKTIDLRALDEGERVMLLDDEEVEAGEYLWMRLLVEADPNVAGDSYITIGGADCELRIPSGDERGLQLIRGFTVGVGTTTDYTIDYDLRRSIVKPPGLTTEATVCDGQAYLMKPVLRLVDNLEVGTITGSVDPTFITSPEACGDATTPGIYPGNVYLFGPVTENEAGTPDDYDGDGDALASAMVSEDDFSYTIAFVPAGEYRLAYTCDVDEVETNEATLTDGSEELVAFTPADGVAVTVAAGQTAIVDFPPPL